MPKLKPFSRDLSIPPIDLTTKLDRCDNILSIEYHLQGDLDTLIIPPQIPQPTRKSLLWEHTCFEFFLGVPGLPEYWEFNLSPAGDWNIYHLDNYRQGLREELAFTSLPFEIALQPSSLMLMLELDLEHIIPIDRDLEVSVTSVIEPRAGEISYWAVTHTGETADFHLRDSFSPSLLQKPK
jgi:hypothetical protein